MRIHVQWNNNKHNLSNNHSNKDCYRYRPTNRLRYELIPQVSLLWHVYNSSIYTKIWNHVIITRSLFWTARYCVERMQQQALRSNFYSKSHCVQVKFVAFKTLLDSRLFLSGSALLKPSSPNNNISWCWICASQTSYLM